MKRSSKQVDSALDIHEVESIMSSPSKKIRYGYKWPRNATIDRTNEKEKYYPANNIQNKVRKSTFLDFRDEIASMEHMENRCGIEISLSTKNDSDIFSDSSEENNLERLKIIDLELEILRLKEVIIKQKMGYASLSKFNQSLVEELNALKVAFNDNSSTVKELQSSLSHAKQENHAEKERCNELWMEHQSVMTDRDSLKILADKYLDYTSKLDSKLNDTRSTLELDIMREKEKNSLLQTQCKEILLERDYFKCLNEERVIQVATLSTLKEDYMRRTQEYDVQAKKYEQLKIQYESVLTEKDEMRTTYLCESLNQFMILEQEKKKCLDWKRQYESALNKNSMMKEKLDDFTKDINKLKDHLAKAELQNSKEREKDKNRIFELQKQIDGLNNADVGRCYKIFWKRH